MKKLLFLAVLALGIVFVYSLSRDLRTFVPTPTNDYIPHADTQKDTERDWGCDPKSGLCT